MRKNKLSKILKAISPDEVLSEKFRHFDDDVAALKKRLIETVNITTLDDVKSELNKFQKKIDFSGIHQGITDLESEVKSQFNALSQALEQRDRNEEVNEQDKQESILKLEALIKTVSANLDTKSTEIRSLATSLEKIKSSIDDAHAEQAKNVSRFAEGNLKEIEAIRKDFKEADAKLVEYVDGARVELSTKMNRGGSANRQINVNSSVMSTKYADINFKSNTAIRWVASEDNTNKRVDIVASLIAGGAGGGGGTPGGSDTQVQFNDGGAFGGAEGVIWNKDASILSVNNVAIASTRAISSVYTVNNFFPTYSGADVTIAHADANFSSVVTALNTTSTLGGTYYLNDGTYTEGEVLIKRSATRLNLSQGATIQANGATTDPLFSPSVAGLSRIIIDGGKLLQTNATAQGVALDLSDVANTWVSHMRIEEFGTGIKMHDTADTTFYNSARDLQMFNVVDGLDLNGQANANLWDNVRIRPKAGQAGTGIKMASVRGNVFLMPDTEPATAASITGIRLGADSRDNLFLGVWVENNEDGVLIDSGANNNVFIGGNITSNTNDIRDSGTNTVFWGVNKTGTKLYKVPKITDTTGKAQLTFNENSGTVRVGQPGSLVGTLQLSASTAGVVTISVPSSISNWAMTLPSNDGNAGQYLLTDGNGITQWASVTAAGGSGITRNISVITANTTAGSAGSVDYVYFAEGGMSFTLPTAVGNTNLYTLKNNSGSSVLVIAPEGVDGSASALMPQNNESLSFISNGSVWGVV